MKIKLMLFLVGIICLVVYDPQPSCAQDKNIARTLYQADAVSDSLKREANVIVRYFSNDVTISAPGKAVIKQHSIKTILNEKGIDEAAMVLFYDKKFNSIKNAQMFVYNAAGNLIKKYSKSDMYDRAASDGFSMIIDDRLLALQHIPSAYPITIETVYEKNINSYLDLADWNIQQTETSVENAVYKITVASDLGFRYKCRNISLNPVVEKQDGYDVYTWQLKNLTAIRSEDDVPEWKMLPKISFATNSFAYAGLPGNISSWQNYGKWYQALNADVSSLSPERCIQLQKLTENCKTDKQKAAYLYKYLQQNVRYVSIQLGIGGLKPFPASFVDTKKYGDCKALANYMYAMLKAVHIPSYYALVGAGTHAELADPEFPADPFNHIILCIPFKNDTTWLECTSNTQPFGKLGAFTENRNALLITEDGGKLVNTPVSVSADNQLNSEVHIKLSPDGSAVASVLMAGSGSYRDIFAETLPSMKLDRQKEYLIRSFNIKQPSALDFKVVSDSAGTEKLNLDLSYDQFYEMASGNKQFYSPRIFSMWQSALPKTDRKTDYYFDHSLQKNCTTVIELPAGFEAESLPSPVNLDFSYGNYQSVYQYDAAKHQIIGTVKFNLNQRIIPAARYNELQEYLSAVVKTQNKKLVIVNKGGSLVNN